MRSRPHREHRPPGRPNRGQTAFDFMVGMGVFLVTLGLVLGFVPSIFQPFDTDAGPDMVTADRSAARLAEDLLVENVTEPGVLNDTCTAGFFDEDGAIPAGCRFSADAMDLHAALAVDEFTRLNVTVERDGTIQDVGGVPLEAGPSPGVTANVVVAERVVLVDGSQMTLFVRVW